MRNISCKGVRFYLDEGERSWASAIFKIATKHTIVGHLVLAIAFAIITLSQAVPAIAASWYVDKSAAGSNNGSSWANAWTSLGSISGVSGGDTVYISGGTTSQTYSESWTLRAGSSNANRIIYRIGQEAGHNGTAIFSGTISLANYTVLDGEYDGSRHFQVGVVNGYDKHYTTVRYATVNGSSWNYNGDAQYYTIEYCYFTQSMSGDHLISFNGPTQLTWGANVVRYNTFKQAHQNNGSGIGQDGLQNITSADIYGNTFETVKGSYTEGQHQDSIQTDGQYMRIYDNYFHNIVQGCFFEGYASLNHVMIFNNLFVIDDSAYSGGALQQIPVGMGWGCATPNGQIRNFYIVHNTIVDKVGLGNDQISLGNNGCSTNCDSTCKLYNNLVYSTSGAGYNYGGSTDDKTNSNPSSGGTRIFNDYSGGDYSLKDTATSQIDSGTSSTSFCPLCADDYLGNARDASPDIGAYEYHSSSAPNPPNNFRFSPN